MFYKSDNQALLRERPGNENTMGNKDYAYYQYVLLSFYISKSVCIVIFLYFKL